MDITVDLLVEVDKLIQLLESPIFICKCMHVNYNDPSVLILGVNIFRFKNGALRRTSKSVFNSSALWTPHDNATIRCISITETQVKMCS
jgi:hypothetical protein